MAFSKKSRRARLLQQGYIVDQKRRKNPPINYELWELHNISQDSHMFLNLILVNKWMDCIYTGNAEHDKKLQFIRAWYQARADAHKQTQKPEEPLQDGQLDLF